MTGRRRYEGANTHARSGHGGHGSSRKQGRNVGEDRDERQGHEQGQSRSQGQGRKQPQGSKQGQGRKQSQGSNPGQGRSQRHKRTEGEGRSQLQSPSQSERSRQGPVRREGRSEARSEARSLNPGPGAPRRVDSESFVYGVRPVLEALERGVVSRILCARSEGGRTQRIRDKAFEGGVPIDDISKADLESHAPQLGHQGVLAHLKLEPVPSDASLDVDALIDRAEAQGQTPLILLLDGVQDPQNLGAILRSAHALGAHGVVIPKDRTARVTAAVVRVSAGAAMLMPVVTVTNLKHALRRLTARNITTVATRMDGPAADQVDLKGPLALVLGGEARGVRPTVGDACDFAVCIPMAAFDSLNVSVAAGILMYEIQRQRRSLSKA
ncbi:MAG: 23S rRNA (guanosine(2251)-2'-O)-methyltransferase RlmB [Deltaproteobacteria bacterium]|nr:23S rRNA (guanosine(2251)-2'-O)-methyltransferase RlmB [Deltaproteobacteria bacterium]